MSVALPDTVCVPLAHSVAVGDTVAVPEEHSVDEPVGEEVCVVECVGDCVPEEQKERVAVAQKDAEAHAVGDWVRLLQGEGLTDPEAQLLGDKDGDRVSVALPDTVCVPLAHSVAVGEKVADTVGQEEEEYVAVPEEQKVDEPVCEVVCVVECVGDSVPVEHKEDVEVKQVEADAEREPVAVEHRVSEPVGELVCEAKLD